MNTTLKALNIEAGRSLEEQAHQLAMRGLTAAQVARSLDVSPTAALSPADIARSFSYNSPGAEPKAITNPTDKARDLGEPRSMTLYFPGMPGVARGENVEVTGLSPQGRKMLDRMRPFERLARFINRLPSKYVPAIAIGSLVTVGGILAAVTPLSWGAALLVGGVALVGGTGVLRVAGILGQAERLESR